jgi:hypothetical protein
MLEPSMGKPAAKANRKEPRNTEFALYRDRNLVERFLPTH